MNSYICQKLQFPASAVRCLEQCEAVLMQSDSALLHLKTAANLFLGEEPDALYDGELSLVAEKTGIHRSTVNFLFLLTLTDGMKLEYETRKISEEVYWDTLSDMTAKLQECFAMYGIWGTFVLPWYRDFFRIRRFQLGRLQYENRPFLFDYRHLKKGDGVFYCHIPSGKPLTEESVADSLAKAHSFFAGKYEEGILPVYCASWLLYPPTAELFAKGSNLRNFTDLFRVLDAREEPSNPDAWRVFHREYHPGEVNSLPENSSLQKALKSYLQSGKSMGVGKGILLFDGKKILR